MHSSRTKLNFAKRSEEQTLRKLLLTTQTPDSPRTEDQTITVAYHPENTLCGPLSTLHRPHLLWDPGGGGGEGGEGSE